MPADTLETHDFVPATYPPDDTQPTTTAATPAPSRQSSNERFDERFVFQQAYYQGSEEPSTDAASSTWRDDRVAGFLPIQPVSHSCPNCPNSFNSTAELKQHKKHCEANIACLLQFAGCEDRFAAANEWKRHMKAQHFVTESYLCTLGDCARDTSRPLLPSPLPWRHVREQIPQYGCRFARKDSHKDHIRNSHWNLLPEVRQKPRKLTAAQEKYLLSLERTPNPVESPIPAVMHCYAPGCNESFQAPGRDKAHGDESSAAPEQVENQSSGSAAAPNRSRAYCDEFLNHMGATHLHGNAPVPDRDADGRGVWLFDYGFANGFLEARTGGKVVTREPLGKSNNKRRAGRRHHRAALSTVAP
ncbi:hypothetical protein O9K51_04438 [Purpureocillium lavendulum]|uniref:C2H2-type domain-containing protein n=1 Tax=Purpureocillium lavendulum TaxID=1247861 RepID=A0AB34FV69_9HYPO|nr:hypothetical protein O9K51_04438 [Purpureocillium lavendulum]